MTLVEMHQPPKILIVDDEPFNIDYLEQELQERGYQTVSAPNGQVALEQVRTENPDLVLLDIMMPVLDGFGVLAQLKADATTCHVPVIVISALSDMASVVKGIQHGAEDYLPKPFNETLLHARIQTSLDKKRLQELEIKYRQSLERELEIGREIQTSFLPARLPQLPGWEIAARFVPARQVAGDFYDAFLLARTKRLVFGIGDVSGKGVGAALFMALYRSLLRILALDADASGVSDDAAQLVQIVTLTNQYVARTHAAANMFASLFIGLLDPLTGTLTYVNAGHNPPLHLKQDGSRAELTRTGTVIGLYSEAPLSAQQTCLAPGEMLVLYTDGVVEAVSPSGEFFDQERLEKLLEGAAHTASETVESIERSVSEFTGDAPQADDITLLAVRRAHDTGEARA